MARKRKLAAAVFSLGCLHAGSLMALGLGELTLESFLNEPLKASVDLLNIDGLHEDQIRVRLATTEDFKKLGLDRVYFLTGIKFDVVADSAGGARIVISSEKPVLEPYLDFIVEARWPSGRLLREYTILIDPPVYSQSSTIVSASQRVAETEGIPAPAPAAAPAKKNEEVGLFISGTQVETSGARVETSGTRVAVRDSNLAPGAMPQRNYNASTAPSPTPGARYMISRDETLWRIADQAKPAGTSVQQEMLEIQRLNPDAFINGNINRIKAGYILYLPRAGDISATDEPAALAEVRAQNAAWREGRDAELYASSGPSLRISAEDEQIGADTVSAGAMATGADEAMAQEQVSPGGVPSESSDVTLVEATEAQERLVAAQEQLETLKRIVSLKDDQIAALQNALADAGVDSVEEIEVDTLSEEALIETIEDVEGFQDDAVIAEATDEDDTGSESESVILPIEGEEVLEAQVSEQEQAPADSPESEPKPAPPVAPATTSDDGWMSYLLYILGALVLGVAGFVFARRRGRPADAVESTPSETPVEDVFSDVQLKQQRIEVEVPEIEEDTEQEPPERDNRGYGEHKHDEYASDADASDALAEADIYIAYGRHPQAIELLNNALNTEPANPVYRLKLLEIYNELKDRDAASAQLIKIRASGDSDSIARAESLMSVTTGEDEQEQERPAETVDTPGSDAPGLSPNPLEMMPESGETLESDFSGLEIEVPSDSGKDEDDLDLSTDFAAGDADDAEEELVMADDSDGFSTKLDLARAYLDMGDDDGARQILDEVVVEGSEQLKAEARALLDRIGS